MKILGSYGEAALAAWVLCTTASSAAAQAASYFDQGWTASDRQYFYRTTQGSRLMSYRVFTGLEQATNTQRFASQANLAAYGYLFDTAATDNPDNLPIGFVKDQDWPKPDAIGLTCAACHTRDVTVKNWLGIGTRYRVDGGQAYSDTERFLRDLEAALRATSTDSAKFARLCTSAGATSSSQQQTLRNELDAATAKLIEENAANLPAGASINNPGPGRLDALGHIKNRVANYVYPANYSYPQNTIDASAPVSFPFLWDAPYQDFTQWPGTVSNGSIGSLARNLGEVTGVFAETNTSRTLGVVTSSSSADISNLVELENRLLKLQSPLWPSAISPISQSQANQGDALFQQYCVSCHVEVDRAPRSTFIPTFAIGANVVGTDPKQADNTLNDRALAGLTSSTSSSVVNPSAILTSVLASVLLPEIWRAPGLDASHKQSGAPSSPVETLSNEPSGHSYKARPLNGIWATAPYLHNGSVRTLADLLLPASQRPLSFCVGSIEIDTANVGMKNDCTISGVYRFDGTQPGSRPIGHEYGTARDPRVLAGQAGFHALSASERSALVEYMKTL